MKAIVREKYGCPDVLELREIDKPAVADGEVLVRVHAASVNTADWILLVGRPFVIRLVFGLGLFEPKNKIPGRDVAGRVEAVGQNVTRFRPGDEIFGELTGGAFAEYVCAPEDRIAPKPAHLTFEEAATAPLAAMTALQGLRDSGRIQAGHKVLVNGASGAVGTFAVQIAKAFGAHVTGVCSTRNLDMVRSIGADEVVDYTREDFTQGDRRYDLMLDLVGSRPLSSCRRMLTPAGVYVSSVQGVGRNIRILLTLPFARRRVALLHRAPTQKDFAVLKELFETGKVKPVIDRRYTLSETPEALRHQGEGHAQGKKVITVRGFEAHPTSVRGDSR